MKLIHLFLLLVLFISISCNKSDDQIKPLLDSGKTQSINEIHKEDITFVSEGVTLAGTTSLRILMQGWWSCMVQVGYLE